MEIAPGGLLAASVQTIDFGVSEKISLDWIPPVFKDAHKIHFDWQDRMDKVGAMTWLWVEQVFLMSRKHINQKQRKGRDFLKETIMIPFFILAFVGYLFYNINRVVNSPDIYAVHNLPPLSDTGTWGIFNPNAKENTADDYIETKGLYYSPNNHQGVESLIAALVAEYPNVKASGFANPSDLYDQYRTEIFTVWAAIEFNLTTDQIATGKLVLGETVTSDVDYTILINENFVILPSEFTDSTVYNDQQSLADKWWTSGYMSIQNFVSTYLTRQYSASSTFQV